jgi:RNA polymerase sigma-70 factor (ECF subfamily)
MPTANPNQPGEVQASPVSEEEMNLVRLARGGDRSAFGSLVLRFQDRIYNAVLRMVGDAEEARDLTQEAFARALAKIDTFRADSAPYTWLFRIAMNLAISHLRKVQRHRVFSLEQPGRNGSPAHESEQALSLVMRMSDGARTTPAEAVEKRERDEMVVAALGRLDAEYRSLLVMRDIEGFDYQQMAEVLGVPLGTLKSRLFRARVALRDELKGYLG